MPDMPPNILLLFSDQHRADALSCDGHPDVLTPNLDRLAAQGVRFANAICQDGVCIPSRTSVMTGLYPRTSGCLSNADTEGGLLHQTYPMAQAFTDAGYTTAAYGKRHLPAVCDVGWAEHRGYNAEESSGTSYEDWLTDPAHAAAWQRDWQAEWGPAPAPFASRPTNLPANRTIEAFVADCTIDFIRQATNENQPFFCWSSFYRPHQPYTPLPEYLARFDTSHWGAGRREDDGLCMPVTLREDPSHLPPGVLAHYADSDTWDVGAARADEQIYRDYLACYYACMEEVDHHIGRILRALSEAGMANNTIVIYASDHGEFAGAHGMPEKAASGHNVYLDSLRVPLIIRTPEQHAAGRLCDDLIELVDLYPTVIDLAGVDLPDLNLPLAGRSLQPALTENAPVKRDYCISENWAQCAIVTKEHVMGIWQNPYGQLRDQRHLHPNMLFDRNTDPHQTTNVYDAPVYQKVRAQLHADLEAWQGRTPGTGRQQRLEDLMVQQ